MVQIDGFEPCTKVSLIKNTKFIDDFICYEIKPVICPCQMPGATNYISKWSKQNDINLNKPKTKFIEIMFSLSGQALLQILEGAIIEKFNTVKLL